MIPSFESTEYFNKDYSFFGYDSLSDNNYDIKLNEEQYNEESEFVFFNNIKKKTKREISKNEKLRKNAESARNARLRKKIQFQNLIDENKILKEELKKLKNKINFCLCEECKKKFEYKNNIIFKIDTLNSFQKKTNIKRNLFTIFSFIGFIFLIINYLSFHSFQKLSNNSLRKLNYLYFSNDKISKDILKQINLTINGLYIGFGDYYNLVYKNYFLNDYNEEHYFFQKNGIRTIDESELNRNYSISNCKNCIIKLNQKEIIKLNKYYRFKLYLQPNKIFYQNNEMNFTEEDEIAFYEIDCISYGFSINNVKTKEL